MAVDEGRAQQERIDRLERQLQDVNDQLRRALSREDNGGTSSAAAQRSVQDILSGLDPEERRLIEDHRAYEQYKRLRSRRIEEEQKSALIERAQKSEEETEEEEGDDRPKPKPKAKAKPKPASRHEPEETETEEKPEAKPEQKPEPWWKRD